MFSHHICKSPVLRSAVIVLLAACTALAQTAPKKPRRNYRPAPSSSSATHAKGAATVAEAQAFMKKAEDQLA